MNRLKLISIVRDLIQVACITAAAEILGLSHWKALAVAFLLAIAINLARARHDE